MEEMECNPESPGLSASEDSDNSQDNETELANIAFYRKQIEENELNYEAHLGLIQALRNMGELEELRKARQTLNKIYPLSPELWMDWLSDEQKICTSEEERRLIIELFKKSVKEYMSVRVWVEYIMFVLGGGKMEETRQVCEEALTAVGIHLAEGILVWQAVILVEQQVFVSLTPDNKDIEEQKKRIQSIYRRQARVPLMNLDKQEFLGEAAKWFDGNVDPQIKRDLENSYKKMLEKLPYEEALLRADDDTEKLEAYRKYIDFVRKSDNPAVIQNIYERTVTDLCLNAGIWEEYVRFVMHQFSSAHYVILPVCERSQLNCPWSSALFELHITTLQTFAQTIGEEEVKQKIKNILYKTLGSGVVNEVEIIRIWMSYLVYLRRRIKWNEESANSELSQFREACIEAIAFIDERLGEEGDKECTIARFQARIEAESAKNMEAARVIWNDYIMKRNNNFKVASLWLEFINLERSVGSEKHCRKLYRRALERVWEHVEVIGSSFLQFEQELGTLETMIDFEKRYKDRLSIVQKKRMEEAMKEESKKGQAEKNKNRGKVKEIKPQTTTSKIIPKVKQTSELKSEDLQPTNVLRGKKRSSSSLEVSPPPGYKKPPEERENESKRPKVTEHGEFITHDDSLDHRTVFLSNMDYNASQEDILGVFADCGPVDSFRLAKDYKGRSKGFGYLVFQDSSSIPNALQKDRTPVGGRPLFVSRCNPKSRDPHFKFSTRLEKEKLFVRGLPFSMNEEEVRVVFEPHGKIKSLRLVTHRNGFSKGTCYVEYHDAETAEKVRQQMDGAVLKDHKIGVFISNPSAIKTKLEKRETDSGIPVSIPTHTGGRQRAKLNLLPRALLRKSEASNSENGNPSTSANGNESANGTPESTPKSNEDFRKMFFK